MVIAEGIERAEELETVKRIGVPLVQGFLLHRPERAAVHAGAAVTDGSAITARLEALLTRPDTRGAEGARAREIVEKGLGASARSAALVTGLLSD